VFGNATGGTLSLHGGDFVEDATHESVAIVPERRISGRHITRILNHVAGTRGVPQVIRTDNGKEVVGPC
jgi:putative transposase